MNRPLVIALTVVAALAVAATAGAWATHSYKRAQQRADDAELTVASLREQLDNATSATVTVTRYVDRVETIRIKGDTIVKEIPRYVTPQADASCTVPVGFVRLHDAAAGNLLDPGAGDADAAPSGLALSAVAGTVAGNYTDSHANAAQLTELQALLRQQGVTILGDAAP